MLIISDWFGRLGNNILQIIHAIHYAAIKNHKVIKFKNKHKMLLSDIIVMENYDQNNQIFTNNFFNLSKLSIDTPLPLDLMKQYFQKYLKPIFKIKDKPETMNIKDDNVLYIHIRGGDIFSQNPHSAYVQPPLLYYKEIIKNYDRIKLVSEDTRNPCIKELLKHDNVEYTSNSLEKDLCILSNASYLAIGFGTFGLLLYMMNPNLKKIYIPDFYATRIPYEPKDNITIISLPNYIKVGEWKNTTEQRKFMLEYTRTATT